MDDLLLVCYTNTLMDGSCVVKTRKFTGMKYISKIKVTLVDAEFHYKTVKYINYEYFETC